MGPAARVPEMMSWLDCCETDEDAIWPDSGLEPLTEHPWLSKGVSRTPASTTPAATDLGLKIEGIFIQVFPKDRVCLSQLPQELTPGFDPTVDRWQGVYHQPIFRDRLDEYHGP